MANNTNKPTKRTQYAEVRQILVDANASDSLIAFIDHEVELLDKKSAKTATGVSEEKKANAELVYTALAEMGRAATPSELINASDNLRANNIGSTQKVAPLLAYLVEEGRVSKTAVNSKSSVYAVIA